MKKKCSPALLFLFLLFFLPLSARAATLDALPHGPTTPFTA
ncbi:MAG: hypothetical protein VB045_09700 [Synergistaceae bacterium]|nr:hypothetical protein [Synergistaceae bacterium]